MWLMGFDDDEDRRVKMPKYEDKSNPQAQYTCSTATRPLAMRVYMRAHKNDA